MSIWQTLPRPLYILAPMEDVTDTVFRRIISSVGRPALYFSEFTNVDGIFSAGHTQVRQRLQFEQEEKPLIAQIWGLRPENFYKAAQELVQMGFDGIDLNMGCPQKDVIAKGACSALINNQGLAQEIIQATKEGAGGSIPVSVKTRLGLKMNQAEEWIPFLLKQDISALTIHGRTSAEMSAVPAHWDEIGNVVSMRDALGVATPIIGNGDVISLTEADEKVKKYGVDGVMIGRGIFHNPWLFARKELEMISLQERFDLLLSHVALFEQTWGNTKPFQVLKKYFKIYIANFPGASELRAKLMVCDTGDEVRVLISSYTL